MSTLQEQREAAFKDATALIEKVKAGDAEASDAEAAIAEVKSFDGRIEAAARSAYLMDSIGSLAPAGDSGEERTEAKSLGEHFVKSVGEAGLQRVKTISGATVAAPEFKAAADTHETPGSFGGHLTDYDRTIVQGLRRPTVADLFGSGSLSGNAITYLVEAGVEGDFETVAEGGPKPQIHLEDPTPKTDALKKIAAFLKFTDEMAEDAPFWVSEINQRGLYLLSLAEENQLLNGLGSGSTIEGLLTRSGVQTESTATDTSENADALFRALTKVQTATGLTADAIVINPADYQSLRLGKDGNGQYFGGGYFAGQYGQGGVAEQPPVWGLRTVVSAAVPAKTAIVGAFGTAATVYRKGGVRVESTNSHASDFTNNLITTRIEERLALAVRIPKAFVNVTLSDVAPTPDAG